ncbi:MAG TPA: type II secretion system protein GspE [Phycisphaerales bacterium]|nr:type II secretion system protein GspE [Phycisphaerales bacterium]
MSTATANIEVKNEVPFGQWLVSKGIINQDELTNALNQQKKTGGKLGEVLLQLKKKESSTITRFLADYLSLEYKPLDEVSKIDMGIARMLPEAIAKRFCLTVVGTENGKPIVAMADPLDVVAVDTITQRLKSEIKIVVSSQDEINRAIEMIYHGSDVEEQSLRDLVETENVEEEERVESLKDNELELENSTPEAATQAPVIRFVDLLLSQAVKSRASDIHIEPQENTMDIRMRIDGVLRDMVPPARKMQAAVITRIKILSDMDIAEHRLPQDGRFKIKTSGRDIDVRVSLIPVIYGEKIVMRILDAGALSHDIAQLGFEPHLLDEFKAILGQPHGIIVITGPTGSGKSTTLYSALNYLKSPTENITTVEDPVEYRLKGINQIQVKSEIGLDFASCLRAILRQDPDVILVGEIRDKETVEIAIKAALTGHLVLSTFHTNDAPSAISRLIYMGIEPYLLISSLNLIIAQRLVRRICEHCKEPIELSEEVVKRLRIDPQLNKEGKIFHGKGCTACGWSGYKGRLPIFEFLVIDNDIREKIIRGGNEMEIRAMARQKGYGGLLECGVTKIMMGLTTAEEVLSVAFAENIKSE